MKRAKKTRSANGTRSVKTTEEGMKLLQLTAPYVPLCEDKIFVIKAGGEVIGKNLQSLARELQILYDWHVKIIFVPGGGPQISHYVRHEGLPLAKRIHGLRPTDEEKLRRAVIPAMRDINIDVVSALYDCGVKAIGLQRADPSYIPSLVQAEKAPLYETESGGKVDLGLVGKVVGVHTGTLNDLLDQRYLIVLSSLGMDAKGIIYNINADIFAGSVAEHMEADKLGILTDVKGVYSHPTSRRKYHFEDCLTVEEAKELMARGGIITKGMEPKLEACIHATESGKVRRAHVADGTHGYGLVLEVCGPGSGTMIVTAQEKRVYEAELKQMDARRRGKPYLL